MKKIRDVPTGVFILAAIFFIEGFQYILFALISILHSIPEAIFNFIIGAFFIICASKFIKLQYQGWQLAVIASGLYLLKSLANIGLNINALGSDAITASIIDAIIASFVLIYLIKSSIKNRFIQ